MRTWKYREPTDIEYAEWAFQGEKRHLVAVIIESEEPDEVPEEEIALINKSWERSNAAWTKLEEVPRSLLEFLNKLHGHGASEKTIDRALRDLNEHLRKGREERT
jgi:hypothetical protein